MLPVVLLILLALLFWEIGRCFGLFRLRFAVSLKASVAFQTAEFFSWTAALSNVGFNVPESTI